MRTSIDRELCERSLYEFIRRGWHTIEPAKPFIDGWALEAVCEHLEAVTKGKVKRLLINIPPGTTKSLAVNVFWPAWEWGPLNRPDLRYISASYETSLAIRDNVRCRDLINSEWYQERWGTRFTWKGDQKEKVFYENTISGFRYAGSVRGPLTGRRGDRIIIDDPHNVQSVESDVIRREAVRWFAETLPTRVNDLETTPFVVIMQRVHEGDIAGYILKNRLGYEHLCLPMEFEPDHPHLSTRFKDPRTKLGEMLWPERFSHGDIQDMKRQFRGFGGTYAEAGQLQQRPAPRGGGMFQRKDFKIISTLPAGDPIVSRARGWDLAATDDNDASPYSVGVKMFRLKSGTIIVVNVERGQWSPLMLYTKMKRIAKDDGPRVRQSVPQDPGQAGKDQKRHMAANLHGVDCFFSPESGSKIDRARPFAAQVEAGNVYLLEGEWNEDFIVEAMSFPNGDFKDQIDASSRSYNAVIKRKKPKVGEGPKVVTADSGADADSFG